MFSKPPSRRWLSYCWMTTIRNWRVHISFFYSWSCFRVSSFLASFYNWMFRKRGILKLQRLKWLWGRWIRNYQDIGANWRENWGLSRYCDPDGNVRFRFKMLRKNASYTGRKAPAQRKRQIRLIPAQLLDRFPPIVSINQRFLLNFT